MQVFCPNDINIYDLSGGKKLPDFLSERKRRDLLRKDVQLRQRIDLIQDFVMPTVCTRVHTSKDGQYIYTAGTYKPRIRCYEVANLSLKFERCLDMEVNDFLILSDDYQKLAILGSDRTIEFHTSQGRHAKLRVPKFGRELGFYPANSELLIACSGSELYRLSLEEGRFLAPYATAMPEVTSIGVSQDHYLVALGGINSMVECWDPRARSAVGCVKLPNSDTLVDTSVTKLVYLSGLQLAAGTNDGRVIIYDIRQTRPLVVKDHMYEKPINQITKNHEHNWIISTCTKSMKIWEADTGKAVTAVEPPARINHASFVPNSGLAFLALEQEKMQTYFVPTLGPAPRWCSFLDCLTEELEETKTDTIYDDYKFLTMEELKSLSLHTLIGTNLLRAYMHGYFIDNRLYQKAKLVSNPFVFEKYKEEQVQKTLKEERVRQPVIKKVKVNQELYIKQTQDGNEQDSRFGDLFKDPEMMVDKMSERYQLLKPVSSTKSGTRKRKDSSSGDEKSGDEGEKLLQPDVFVEDKAKEADSADSLSGGSSDDSDVEEPSSNKVKVKRMAVKRGVNISSIYDPSKTNQLNEQRKVEEEIPLEKRVSTVRHDEVRHVKGGKVFQLHTGQDKTDHEQQKKRKIHVKERRKNIRNAEGLLKKHRSKDFGK